MPQQSTEEKLNAAVKGKGPETLPPAGYLRQEALRRREDALQRQIEELSNKYLIHSIDPSKFTDLDPEIVQFALDGSDIPNRQPGYEYLWVEYNTRNPSDHGEHVTSALMVGYKLVTENDPEAKGLDHASFTGEGYIRWGSGLLARIPQERYITLRAKERADSRLRQGYHLDASKLVELSERHNVKIHTELPPEAIAHARQQYAMRQRQQKAWNRIDTRLREGTAHLPD